MNPEGELGAFEVKYNDELLYSRLATDVHPEFNDIRGMIAERLKKAS